jgi:hypothetical protein
MREDERCGTQGSGAKRKAEAKAEMVSEIDEFSGS